MVEILVLEGNETIVDWQDALRFSGRAMYEKGFVKEGFAQACIKREEIFPTGLTSDEPVAIPHADMQHVIKNSICFLRLKEPVVFQRMDDPSRSIQTRLVVNMAIGEGENQVFMLQKLIQILKSKEKVQYCISCSEIELSTYAKEKLY